MNYLLIMTIRKDGQDYIHSASIRDTAASDPAQRGHAIRNALKTNQHVKAGGTLAEWKIAGEAGLIIASAVMDSPFAAKNLGVADSQHMIKARIDQTSGAKLYDSNVDVAFTGSASGAQGQPSFEITGEITAIFGNTALLEAAKASQADYDAEIAKVMEAYHAGELEHGQEIEMFGYTWTLDFNAYQEAIIVNTAKEPTPLPDDGALTELHKEEMVLPKLGEYTPERQGFDAAQIVFESFTPQYLNEYSEIIEKLLSETFHSNPFGAYALERIDDRDAWEKGFNAALLKHFELKSLPYSEFTETEKDIFAGNRGGVGDGPLDTRTAEHYAQRFTDKYEVPVWVDQNENRKPYAILMQGIQVGDFVSKYFNGDYYPVGRVTKITGYGGRVGVVGAKIITVRDHEGVEYKFWRRKLTGSWVQSGGTWALCLGWHNRRNPSF